MQGDADFAACGDEVAVYGGAVGGYCPPYGRIGGGDKSEGLVDAGAEVMTG